MEMQLHACLLLFIITTDKTLASSHHHCGGDVSLDQEPAGNINLTLPGNFTDTNRPNSTNHQSNKTLPASVCTWTIGIPLGQMVILKLLWLETGSRLSVRCFRNEDDHFLEMEGTALLSRCDTNKAILSWTGVGHSSNSMQLSYYVQEDERNSSEDHTSPHSDQDPVHWSQTGTSFTSIAPVGQEVVRGTEGSRGHLYEGLEEWSSRLQSASSPTSQDQGLLHPTSLPQWLTVAGKTDRETLPLPEEEQNKRADTSGASHLTDGPISARERTHPYFQHTFGKDMLLHTTQIMKTETDDSSTLHQTQMPLKHATASSSDTMFGTEIYKQTATHKSKLSKTTQVYPPESSSLIPNLTSSPTKLTSWITRETESFLSQRVRAVSRAPGERLYHSWRRQRSTHRLHVTSGVTHDPLKFPAKRSSSNAHTDSEPTASSSYSKGPTRMYSSTTHTPSSDSAVGTADAASFNPSTSQNDSYTSSTSDVTSPTSVSQSSGKFDDTVVLHTFTFSTQSQTHPPQSTVGSTQSTTSYTLSPFTQPGTEVAQTATHSTQRNSVNTYITTNTVSSSPDVTEVDERTSSGSSFAPGATLPLGAGVQSPAVTGTPLGTETYTLHPIYTHLNDHSPTNSPIPDPHLSSSASIHSSAPSYTPQTHTTFSSSPPFYHISSPLPSIETESAVRTRLMDHKTMAVPSQTSSIISTSSYTTRTQNNLPSPSSSNFPATHKNSHNFGTTTHSSLFSLTTASSENGHQEVDVETQEESRQGFPSSTAAGPPWQPPPSTTLHPSQRSYVASTSFVSTSIPQWSSTTHQTPKFYIVPDQPAAIRVESFELLLQVIVDEPRVDFASGLEEDVAAWLESYLKSAPGFSRLLGVWSSGCAVQSLVEFKTSGALQWLSMTGPTSLLERTGLAQALHEGRSFRSSKITNITLGGLQADVCEWLLQCQAGYTCVSQPGTSNYSCSSICHFDYCHHHGICTHHTNQLPVCHCLVGEDFWFMGQKCDVRMTRARLVGACLATLLVMVTVIGILAFVAVRRYRAILIQAKVDQTRSSYRRFNHFDELSGRFWLRSWAGSADSLDNPAFTRSDELLHLRALDRPCCYHDDTLSLASTCPSHGTHINTIYPHSSQYGWRGSEMSMGDGVLDSGKASDLSVCSWPVEPIQWTPFPLLQQLASHRDRTPTVRVSRPRSYCEGMELVDLGKSWTA